MDLGDHDDRRPRGLAVSPMAKKTRSLSDGGGTASTTAASNSTPAAVGGGATTSKDDSDSSLQQQPTTPHRPLSSSLSSGLFFLPALPPQRKTTPPPAAAPASASGTLPTTATATAAAAFARPLSPHLDRSSTYASGVNVLPRRSRGLDFSRAATSLHHSTLAESSPESSPGRTAGAGTGAGAINIPGRRRGPPFETTAAENTSTSLWSMMGDQERINLSHSLGSNNGGMHGGGGGSDSSSSSDDDDLMDDDDDAAMDEPYVTTPHVSRTAPSGAFGSPATGGLASFQQRQRHHRRNQGKHHYKARVPFGAGSSAAAAAAASSSSAAFARTGSPPLGARRDSISWQANQLHISGMDGDDVDGLGDGHPTVVRRAVTRRGNLLPKTKTFARIRAALFEEGAPAEAECKREAEVVKQVRDSDVPDLEPRRPAAQPWLPGSDAAPPPDAASVTAASSPAQEPPLDVDDDNDMMGDLALGLSSSFKQHAMRNSKGKMFWDTFSETSSVGGGRTTTPPPPSVSGMPRAASSNMSEDVGMDSPSQGMAGQRPLPSYFGAAGAAGGTGGAGGAGGSGSGSGGTGTPQTPADITRRINGKRRRDDDWDPASFKRRAVSPSLSVHGSPMPQSPMQPVWGSRPGSNGADRGGSISAASDSGSVAGGGSRGGPAGAGGKRVGLQGMVDTNDGIMRMSIE